MNMKKRLADLEIAHGELRLHIPEDGDDHARVRASLQADGAHIGVVHFPGLNDGAVAAFNAAGAGR